MNFETKKKILIIKNDKIGDMVLSANVFRELKKEIPHSEITVVASKANQGIIEKNSHVDRIITLDYEPMNYQKVQDYLALAKQLKHERFDVGIDLRGSFFNVFFLLRRAKVKYAIGFYNRFFSRFFFDYAYKKDRKNTHVTVQRIDLINKALRINAKNNWPEIATDEEDNRVADEFIKKNKLDKFVCIVPDASLEYKQWSLHNFDDLIKWVLKEYPGYKIVMVGVDKDKLGWIAQRNPSVVCPSELLSLRVTYLLFKRSSLVIAHDGGPMHIAWVSKANLITFVPPHLSLNYYGPRNVNARVISKETGSIELAEVKNYVKYFLSGE